MAETGKGGADKGASMRVDTALVRELAELLSANDLNEIEVEDGDRKIKVRRDAPTAYVAAPAPVASVAPAAAPAAASDTAPATPQEDVGGEAVKSPMVGTAFLSPEPGAKPFIAVGQPVKAGDVTFQQGGVTQAVIDQRMVRSVPKCLLIERDRIIEPR